MRFSQIKLSRQAFRIPDKAKMPLLFALLFSFILIVIFCFLGKDYVFGSYIDWNSQHGVLPDYFRQKFYETGSLFPSLALELGGGINPYLLAYHGMLNPVLLPSYLFPRLNMYDYIIISSLILYFASLVLLYLWMRQNHFGRGLSYFAALLLAFSGAFLFQFHKQVMFVDYFPFLILSLMGIDRMLLRRKKALFIISFALAIMTSIFYSIALIITVSVYFFYRYLKLHHGIGKNFIRRVGGFALSGICSCLLTCIVIFPSFMAITAGREANAYDLAPSVLKLFIPRISFSSLLYSNYGAGLGLIVIFALFALLFIKKPHSIFLSAALLFLWLFPIGSYAMNAFLYIRGKAYICLLPLLILSVCIFIRDGATAKIPKPAMLGFGIILVVGALLKIKFLPAILLEALLIILMLFIGKKKKTSLPLCISSVCVAITIFIVINSAPKGDYLTSSQYKDNTSPAKENMLNSANITFPTRMGDITTWYACNMTYPNGPLRSSVYSSASNLMYLHLCHDMLHLTNPTFNKITVADVNDLFFSTLMGEEWIVGDSNTEILGYEAFAKEDKWTLYHTENAYTLGFASKNIMSSREFDSLNPAERQFALLKYAVVDNDSLPDVYVSPFTPLEIDSQIPIERDRDGWHLNDKSATSFDIIPNAGKKECIYAVRIDLSEMQEKGIAIKVNGIRNALSGRTNVFPNDNFDMWFIISDFSEKLTFNFSRGDYTVSAIEVYAMDAEEFFAAGEDITMTESLSYDKDSTLNAKISLDRPQTFLFTIPYDSGFTLTVDGKETPIKVVDRAFIGCELDAGEHEIVLTYKPPYRAAGICLAAFGGLLFVGLVLWDNSKKFQKHKNVTKGKNHETV